MSKTNAPSLRFWAVLATINVLILVYPAWLCSSGGSDQWFGAILLVCALFALLITDIVSVLVTLSLFEY
jgi:hypothetical protein